MVDPTPSGGADVTADSAGWSEVARGVEYRGDDLERDVARARARQGLLQAEEESIRVGRYVVVHRVGEGGMGVVYAAYDPELDRRVALKVLRPTPGGDEAARQRRLLREARALAKLSHPNVVAVHDVGTYTRQSGGEVVFIAMEFVDGATLGRWVEDESPPWRTRLDLMLQAGRGLAAAHAAGLVHRDFKPDNVMIGRDGRARVMDFGLVSPQGSDTSSSPDARYATLPTTQDPTMTAEGAIIGTPAYMAPEQHLGLPADARSDQFGFCVTLWETLHGARPFKGDTPVALAVTMMSDVTPTAPTGTAVPAWLRRVIARGLAKEPADRFATMDDLLAALAADPARTRQRWLAVGALGVAASAAFGWNQWQRARAVAECRDQAAGIAEVWNDDARASVRAAILAPQLSYGSSSWERVEPRLDRYAARWSELREATCIAALEGTRAVDLVARSDECLLERRGDFASAIEVLGATERATVHSAVPIVDALPQLDRCDDTAWLARRREQTDAFDRRESVAEQRRELARARALRAAGNPREALAVAEPVLERADAIGWTPLRVDAMLAVGTSAEATGDAGRAAELYEAAFALAVDDGDDEDAIEALASLVGIHTRALGRPEQAEVWARVAEAFLVRSDPEQGLPTADVLVERGGLHRVRGDYPGAEADFARAFEIRERVLGPESLQTLAVLNNLAASQFDKSEYDAAIATLHRVVDGRTSVLGPEHPDVARALMMLAAAKGAKGEYDEGLELLERALAILERVHGPDSPNLALTLHNLGTMHDYAGNFEAATAAHRRELAIRESIVPPAPLEVARANLGLGRSLGHHGDSQAAVAYLERARAGFERVLGPDHPDVGLCLEELASAYDDRGEHDEALVLRRRVLAIREQAYGPDHNDVATALAELGKTQMLRGDTDAALDALRRSLLVYLRTTGPEHHNVANSLSRIGHVLHMRGELDSALAALESSQVIDERALGSDHVYNAIGIVAIGQVQRDRGAYAEALRSFELALASEERRLGPDHADVASILVGVAEAELGLGRVAKAEEHARRAVETLGGPDVDPVARAEAELVLAEVLWSADHERAGARRLADQACALAAPPSVVRLRRCRDFPPRGPRE